MSRGYRLKQCYWGTTGKHSWVLLLWHRGNRRGRSVLGDLWAVVLRDRRRRIWDLDSHRGSNVRVRLCGVCGHVRGNLRGHRSGCLAGNGRPWGGAGLRRVRSVLC